MQFKEFAIRSVKALKLTHTSLKCYMPFISRTTRFPMYAVKVIQLLLYLKCIFDV